MTATYERPPCEITHSVLVPCGQGCVYVHVVLPSLSRGWLVTGASEAFVPPHQKKKTKNSAVKTCWQQRGKSGAVCQSMFYLQLHIAAIMLTAIPTIKHTHRTEK